MVWINKSSGQTYEGDQQFGDREATQNEVNAKQLQKELAALAVDYKADLFNFQTAGYLSAIVADGPTEEAKKASFVQLIATRTTQYKADQAALRAKYAPK